MSQRKLEVNAALAEMNVLALAVKIGIFSSHTVKKKINKKNRARKGLGTLRWK